MITHQPYPSDVSDAEWAFVLPYLCLLPEDAGQREHNLRDVFDALRWLVRTGSPWRYLPKDFPPWEIVYQQTRRWLAAACFEAIVHDLRAVLRFAAGKEPEPTAVILDGRTIQSTPESGGRAGYDGYKRRKGSKVHIAVDTLGHLLALRVTVSPSGSLDGNLMVLTPLPERSHRGPFGPDRVACGHDDRSATARCTAAGTPATPRPVPPPWQSSAPKGAAPSAGG